MRARALLAVPVLLAVLACATPKSARTFVHPEFATRRPVTVALEVKAPEADAAAIRDAVNAGLIAKNYSVQVADEPMGREVGFVRVVAARGSGPRESR